MSDTQEEDAMQELIPLNHEGRHLPDLPHEAHLRRVVKLQEALTRTKYLRGQELHGGHLWEKPGMLAHALEESTDLSVYLLTLKDQIESLASSLRTGGISPHDCAEALERLLAH